MTPQTPAPAPAAPSPSSAAAAPPPAAPGRRRRRLVGAAVLALAGATGLGMHLHHGWGDVDTDDAQVEADVVTLAARVGGPVAQLLVRENAHVDEGQLLFRIDPADYRARVDQATAELASARAQVLAALAQAEAARASWTRSQAEAEKARLDLDRADALLRGDAIAAQSHDATRIESQRARAGEEANRAQYSAALAGAGLARARVQAAAAALEVARLQAAYTEVRAPTSGVVSRLGARVGQLVQPGQVLAHLVPDRTYVVANFKETQTGELRPGQRVEVTIDAYGGRVLQGTVESVAAGTGTRFALLPSDNASGNFVKVVERIPVRIVWVAPPPALPLRAGLSAFVTVHTR